MSAGAHPDNRPDTSSTADDARCQAFAKERTTAADPANRSAVQIARNLLEGAAVVTRAHQLRTYAVPVPAEAFAFTPRRLV